MQVVVDSLLTNYQKTGSGEKTILLLHGWGDSLKTFNSLQSALSQDYTVVSLDLPGFGASQAPAEVWDLSDYAQFTSQFLNKIKTKSVNGIIAHSNGGALAIWAISHKDIQTDRLILLGASGIRNRQKGKHLAIKVVAKTGKVATFWLPEHHKQRLRKKLYGAVGSDLLVAPHLQETFKRTVRQDVQAEAKQLKLPVLLIYGEKDKATPILYGQIYHELIGSSTLEIIGEAGHFVHNDKPEQVEQLIKVFLS